MKDAPIVLGGRRAAAITIPRWPIFGRSEENLLEKVLTTGKWAYDGPMGEVFEQRFATLHSARCAWCVSNGTAALQLALEAVDVGVGDEVIVPGLTWQATAASVVDVNAVPVLVDVEPETYCIAPDALECAITRRTKAVIVVHLYCSVADMDHILAIARSHGLLVVEDCAHSHGSQWRGTGVGSLGDIGCFSFQSSKTLTAGEGGCVVTSQPELCDRLYRLRNCGRSPVDAHTQAGPVQSGNYRMTEWQAAVLCAQLERFEEQLGRRERARRWLDHALSAVPGVSPLLVRPQITRQGLYAYVFRYNQDEFSGLPVSVFRKALSAELGVPVLQPYHPLNCSPLYQPQTKRRHRLSDDYWNEIAPQRFHLPICERAFHREAVVIPHEVLLADPSELALIPDAILRLAQYSAQLARWGAKTSELWYQRDVPSILPTACTSSLLSSCNYI